MSFVNPKDQKIHFKGAAKDAFLADIRKQVENYFTVANKSKAADWTLHVKTAALFLGFVLLYGTLINGWLPFIPRALIWILFGLNQAFIAVNVGHDALHGSYSLSPRVNKCLGYLAYDCIGLSSYVWKQTHNREHHTFTNIAGVDPDIHKPGVLRLSPHDPGYSFHRFQHLYSWILYALVSLNWVVYADYAHVLSHRKEIPKSEWGPFFFFKAVNLFLMLIVPLMWSPMAWWQVATGFVLMHCAGGIAVAVIFQLAHVVENVDFPLPDEEGVIASSWGEHEMTTTSNFATNSPFVTHLVGGLNFQVEHHLLPKISHCHYPQLSKIVRQTAKEHNLPYHEQPTMLSAVASHSRLLRRLGKEAVKK